MRLDAAVAHGATQLASISESARLDAELLLCRCIDMPRSYLFAHPEDELDEHSRRRFEDLLTRRAKGEPLAYITGNREFWSHDFLVTPATLIPRPETELLVDLALREIPRSTSSDILDLGTGSGAIAIAIASERPHCLITATDKSAEALAVAQENALRNNVNNIELLQGDWTAAVAGRRFDVIVSNPPYVREDAAALANLSFEPKTALVAGPDGLDAIRVLAAECPGLVAGDGRLLIEHGADQQADVAALLARYGWTNITCHNDLAGLPRVTAARHSGT